MQKLPTFDSAKHEFTYFATVTMKNAMAVQAIENYLNIVAERINELIDRDSSVDLETFKKGFLAELAELLDQNCEYQPPDNLFDLLGTERANLKDSFKLLELQFQVLTERVSRIESALGHQKVEQGEKSNIFDLLV